MVETTKDTYDFFKSALPIHIGILSSADAENVCQRNNLSFCELIEPFCTLTNETQAHGISSQSYRVYNMRVHAFDIRKKRSTIQDPAIRQLQSDLISRSVVNENLQMVTIPCGEQSLYVNRTCPWMDIYRNSVFRSGPPQDHEFLCHLVACMLIVSTQHPNPLQEFANLSQLQNRIQHNESSEQKGKWMTPNTLKYYVLLHDVEYGDASKAKEVMSSLQSMYGHHNSYLLRMNSRSPVASDAGQDIPVPWQQFKKFSSETHAGAKDENALDTKFGCCFTMADHNLLQCFLQDFITLALLPFMERTIKSINDQLSARKTLHKSLFRATRTFFGSSKSPASATSGTGYHHDANELLVRKVADLCFLCQMYDQAFHFYHAAKKDYMNDQTWLHAAGASEMAAVSNFMQRNAQKTFPAHYMENAINSYMDVCKNDYLALRCTLMHIECLQTLGFYQDAAFYLVKMTNETDDLRSALLLEQAAHCYLKMRRRNPRKFAFQLILAGHRFGKCGQSIHALHCYEMASQIYQGKGWLLVEDHLNLAIARQSCNTRRTQSAVDFFRQLLMRESSRPEAQQLVTLREFFNVWQQCNSGPGNFSAYAKLGLPKLEANKTNLFLHHSAEDTTEVSHVLILNSKIAALEESFLGSEGLIRNDFVGAVSCMTKATTNNQCPQLAVGESAILEITMKNHLCVSIGLMGLQIDWDFVPSSGEKESENFVSCNAINWVYVPPSKEVKVKFSVKLLKPGKLTATSVTYNLSQVSSSGHNFGDENYGPFVRDRQLLQISGRRLNKTEKEKQGLVYDVDYRLTLKALPALPQMSAAFEGLSTEMMCNELSSANFVVRNVGNVQLDSLKAAASDQVQFTLESCNGQNYQLPNVTPPGVQNTAKITAFPSLLDKPLLPGESAIFKVLVKAPSAAASYRADIMLYCKSNSLPTTSYRAYFLKHSIKCSNSIDVHVGTVTPLTQSRFVVAVATKNVAVNHAGLFTLADVQCEDGAVQPISERKSSRLMLDTNMYTYFNLQRSLKSVSESNENVWGALQVFNNNPDSLRVEVNWSCENGPEKTQFHGQHKVCIGHLLGNLGTFSPAQGNEMTKPRSDSDFSLQTLHHALSWRLHYHQSNPHDFAANGLCVVCLNLLVFNLSDWELTVNVSVPRCAERSAAPSQTGFSWLGTNKLCRVIKAHGEINLSLKAGFTRSGVFSLSGVSVTALPKQSKDTDIPIPQKPMCGYYIDVIDSSSRLSSDPMVANCTNVFPKAQV